MQTREEFDAWLAEFDAKLDSHTSALMLRLGRDCPATCTCRGMSEAYVPRFSRFMEREERAAAAAETARDDMPADEYAAAVQRALKLVHDA